MKDSIINNTIQKLEYQYIEWISLTHRKKFAQFFTPYSIAKKMVQWVLAGKKRKDFHLLEPAFGLGIFSRIACETNSGISIKGFEVDKLIFTEASKYFDEIGGIDIYLQDYLYADWKQKYDGIVCNPPYFKFHDFKNKAALKEVENKLGYELNGFTNLHSLFLLKSIFQLKEGGRAAYIMPSEFLNADYGTKIKNYLIEQKVLRHVIIVDFKENVFEEVLTTACILLLAKEKNFREVHFTSLNKLTDLDKINLLIKEYPYSKGQKTILLEDLKPEIKWRAYYQTQNAAKYKNLVPFSNYGKVVRGIATGANNYFTFNLSKAADFHISTENLLPCICKSIFVKKRFFTKMDFDALAASDKPAFLFHAANSNEESVHAYIKKGEKEKFNERYLTKNRKPWYALEKRPPSPIWVTVFNRKGLRFIRNEAMVSNLTTYHCVYLDLFSAPKIDLIFAYLLTDVAKEIFNDNRREYGNGLKKFEPNDINKGKMLDLGYLSEMEEQQILDLYQKFRQSEMAGTPNLLLVKEINSLFISKYAI